MSTENISFCPYVCDSVNCIRNKKNIRDYNRLHSFCAGIPHDCPLQKHEEYEPTCAGCIHWDGDDGRCRNPNSTRFMQETDDGCERRDGR